MNKKNIEVNKIKAITTHDVKDCVIGKNKIMYCPSSDAVKALEKSKKE